MRSVFLFLLLLNFMYGLWSWQQIQHRINSLAVDAGLEVHSGSPSPSPSPSPTGSGQAEGGLTDSEAGAEIWLCMRLGPFQESIRANQLRQRLLASGVDSQLEPVPMDAMERYLLLVEARPGQTAEQIVRSLGRLEQRAFVVREGVHAGRVALGIYDSIESARAEEARLRAERVVVFVEKTGERQSLIWLEVAPKSRRLVDQSMLSRLRSSFPGLQHQFRPCVTR